MARTTSLSVLSSTTMVLQIWTATITPAMASATATASAWPALQFTQDGTFQIAIFEDLHFGEAEGTDWGPLQDVDTLQVMQTVLDNEAPQLVVLNGDLITGEDTFQENATDYVDEIVAPLVAAGLPWASTYGNHDSDFNLSRANIYEREKTYSNSLTGRMVDTNDSGVSNYYLPVYSHDKTDPTPALILWFFDSRGGNYYQETSATGLPIGQPNWVSPDVVTWFTQAHANLTSTYRAHSNRTTSSSIPSLAFVHIPIDAFLALQNDGEIQAHQEPGLNEDVPLAQQGVQAGEGASATAFAYDGQDVPLMQALLATAGLRAVFSGHDHGNDWCGRWNGTLAAGGMNLTGHGLDLCFGRHTGYGGYGSWTRGSRQVLVRLGQQEDEEEEGEEEEEGPGGQSLLTYQDHGIYPVETWTRLEDGNITGAVTLNATFGRDEYPAVALSYTSEYDEGHPYYTR